MEGFCKQQRLAMVPKESVRICATLLWKWKADLGRLGELARRMVEGGGPFSKCIGALALPCRVQWNLRLMPGS